MTGAETGRRWLFALVALAVLAGSAGVAATVLLRSSALKTRIERAAYRATGRRLLIAGKVRPMWSLSPGIAVTGVSLANIPGGSRPDMVTAKRFEAHLALLPLLRGQVEITSATLVQPDIVLERDAAGHPNWLFYGPKPGSAIAAAEPHRPEKAARLDTLQLSQARVTLHDLLPGRTIVLDMPQLRLDLASDPVQLNVTAGLNGVSLTGQAEVGRTLAKSGYPAKVTLTGAGAAMTVGGSYDPATGTVSGQLDATAAELSHLAPLLPFTPPPMRQVRLAATLPPASLSALATSGALAQPVRVEVAGTVLGGAWHAAASLLPSGASVALRGLEVTSPAGDLAGDVALTSAPKPALRGTLVSTRLDADALRTMLASRPAAMAPAPSPVPDSGGSPAAKPASPPRLFSDTPLPWRLLRVADADLQVSIGALHAGGADYHNAAGHLGLNDGALAVSPFAIIAPEGPIALSASADARAEPPPVAIALQSGGFSIDALLQALGLPGGSSGAAELDLALHAAGDTPHALAASLTGHAGVALVNGAIANAALAAVLGDALKSAGLGLEPGGQSAVRCLALRLDARAGQVTVSALKLDTSRLSLEGGGTADLAAETLALQLRPVLRLGGTGVAAPLRLGGTLLHPAVGMESPDGAPGRSGFTIGGLSAPAEDCGPELTAARDGRAGPMPTTVASKSVKPADLLRSLLR